MIEAEINLRDIDDGFGGLSRRATEDCREFWQIAKPLLKRDLRQHGQRRQGPGGSAWAPASPAGAPKRGADGRFRQSKRKRRRSRGNLGKITTAWKSFISPEAIKFRNMVDWAAAHNDGGTVGRGARLPARKFAYWSPEVAEEVSMRWRWFVASGWGAGGSFDANGPIPPGFGGGE